MLTAGSDGPDVVRLSAMNLSIPPSENYSAAGGRACTSERRTF